MLYKRRRPIGLDPHFIQQWRARLGHDSRKHIESRLANIVKHTPCWGIKGEPFRFVFRIGNGWQAIAENQRYRWYFITLLTPEMKVNLVTEERERGGGYAAAFYGNGEDGFGPAG